MGMYIRAKIAWGIDLNFLPYNQQDRAFEEVWRGDNDLEVVSVGWEQAGELSYILTHENHYKETGVSSSDYHITLDNLPKPSDEVVNEMIQYVTDNLADEDIEVDDLDVKFHLGYITG